MMVYVFGLIFLIFLMILNRSNRVKNLQQKTQLEPIPKPSRHAKALSSNSAETTHQEKMKADVDLAISRYPLFEYVVSIFLMCFFVYAAASLSDITWGLPTFNKKQWWHFCVVFVLFAFAMAVMFNSDCETLYVLRKRDLIIHQSSKFFCVFSNIEEKKISNIIGIQIVASGAASKVSLHSRWYGNQFSFKDCSKIVALRCISEQNAIRYRQMIIEAIGKDKIIDNHILQ